MKNSSVLTPQLVFWGICLIVLCWLSATFLFEVHLGWPANSVQWIKRVLGWGVEFWLVRTLVLKARRCYPATVGR